MKHWRVPVRSLFSAGNLLAAAFAVALLACGGPDEDRIWDVGERREVFTSLLALPNASASAARGWFQVFVPLGLNRSRLTLAAHDALVLGKGVTVIKPSLTVQLTHYGVVSSLGQIAIERNTKIGSVYALGTSSPRIEPGAIVSGYVRAAGHADLVGRSTVGIGIMENAGVSMEGFGWQVDFPAHNLGKRISRASDASLVRLEPGAYQELLVTPGSAAAIRSGTYYFERLTVEERGVLEIVNTDGPVYVWVRDALELHGAMLDYSFDGNVLFGYAGVKPVVTGAFRGTLVAPAATVRLQASPAVHSGAFYAREIHVEDGTTVEQRAFLGSPRDPQVRSMVCNRCGLSAQRQMRSCCTELDRARALVRHAQGRCEIACLQNHPGPPGHCRAQCSAWAQGSGLGARANFDQCTQAATSLYVDCQLSDNYRPDTCRNSGYPDFGVETCEP